MGPLYNYNIAIYNLLNYYQIQNAEYHKGTSFLRVGNPEPEYSLFHIKSLLESLQIPCIMLSGAIHKIDFNIENDYIIHCKKSNDEHVFYICYKESDNIIHCFDIRSGKKKKIEKQELITIATGSFIKILVILDMNNPYCDIRKQQEASFKRQFIIIKDFLPDEYCDYVSNISTPYLVDTNVVEDKGVAKLSKSMLRASWSMEFARPEKDQIFLEILSRISSALDMPTSHFEGLKVSVYNPGEEYKNSANSFDHISNSTTAVNRCNTINYTVLIYLNDDFEGGETVFPMIDYKVTPKKGMLFAYPNLNEHGASNILAIHRGSPIIRGTKRLITWCSYIKPRGNS